MILYLRYFRFIHALRAPKIGYLDDHSLADEYILWFEIAMEDSLDIHHNKGLYNLPEKANDF